MEDYDVFFKLTELPFDPPEKSAVKIKTAVDKKIKEREKSLASLGGGAPVERQREEKNRIDLLKEIYNPSDGEFDKNKYLDWANKKTRSEIKKLEATVGFIAWIQGKVITEAAIDDMHKKSGLSKESVEKAFAGFEIKPKKSEIRDIKGLFPSQIEMTDEKISALSKSKDSGKYGVDTSLVVDLYSFVACFERKTECKDVYREKTSKELCDIFDKYSREKFTKYGENFGELCGNIASYAKKQVFNSEENRAKYEFYLKYKNPELREFFDKMKSVPDLYLLQSVYAEPCINKIAEKLDCDYDTALDVYNHEGRVSYSPIIPVYLVKCRFCETMNQYSSEQEAVEKNSCKNCNKELFQKCDKCGRMVLVSLRKCPYPDCDYIFASAEMFSKYYADAEEALRQNDFDLARKYLREARSAGPNEKQRIEQLSSKIESEENRYKKPINGLNALILDKKFVKAQEVLSQIIQNYPSLNTADFEKSIKAAIARADSDFATARSLAASKRADACISILQYCTDHQPSLNFLHATPPAPVRNFSAIADSAKGCVNLAWTVSTEQGVKYHLIRKNGQVPSVSISEGTILMENEKTSSFCDDTAIPGNIYSYSLFVSRMGVFSAAATMTAVLYSDVQNLRAVQNRNSIRLTWDMPPNSMGATVTRTAFGEDKVLSPSAYGSLEDADIQYGIAYTYKVSVNYSDSQRSPGIKTAVTPLVIIDSFRIKAAHVKDNFYKVEWDIRQPGVDLRIMVNGSLASECTSDDNAVRISLPRESFSTISVKAHSGGQWTESENSIQVNTYSPCSIDKNRTELAEEAVTTPNGAAYRVNIKIRLSGGMSNKIAGFYYAVRTSSNAAKWAVVGEIGRAHDIRKISIREYKEKDGIVYSELVTDEQAFFVSVFTIYDVGGKEVISEPGKARVDRIIYADLFWKVSKGFLGPLRLTISIESNRPIGYIPEFVLCSCDDGDFISSYHDQKAAEVLRIGGFDLDEPQKNYTQSYDLTKADYRKNMKFFLFEMNPVPREKFTLRWAQGFKGKV